MARFCWVKIASVVDMIQLVSLVWLQRELLAPWSWGSELTKHSIDGANIFQECDPIDIGGHLQMRSQYTFQLLDNPA